MGFTMYNPPEKSKVEGGMVFNLFPDTVNLLLVARGVTQLINSYAVNMKTLIMLGILLYSCLCLCFNVFMFYIL